MRCKKCNSDNVEITYSEKVTTTSRIGLQIKVFIIFSALSTIFSFLGIGYIFVIIGFFVFIGTFFLI